MLVNKYNYMHKITPQMRKVVERVEEWKKTNPMRGEWTSADGIEEYRAWYKEERAWWNEGGPQMEKTEDIWIPGGPHGQVNVRLHYPVVQKGMPIIIFNHGGGYVCGDNDTHSRIMRILADKSGACVIGVNYKLAPEAGFPSQILENVAVTRYFHEHGAEYGLDGNDIALCGDSGGSVISLATMVYLRNEYNETDYISAALLYYAVPGINDGTSTRLWGNEFDELVFDKPVMAHNNYNKSFIREDQLTSPYYDVTMNNDLSWGIAPTFIAVGGADPLKDGCVCLYEMLYEHGHTVELHVYEGIMHAFLHYSRMLDMVYDSIQECVDFWERARYIRKNK